MIQCRRQTHIGRCWKNRQQTAESKLQEKAFSCKILCITKMSNYYKNCIGQLSSRLWHIAEIMQGTGTHRSKKQYGKRMS
jgi:hypothetical protein